MSELPVFSVSEAVAVINQTLEYAYPMVVVVGELAQFQIAKQKWLYGDVKDDQAKLRLFGTVYQLQTPLEDGMLIEVVARPQLHPQFGFSLQIVSIKPVGEGSIKKSARLLEQKLEAEGLFAEERKRQLPYPPERIGLIASGESAAYADFVKIAKARWPLASLLHKEVQVQGEAAVTSVVSAIHFFNERSDLQVDVLVLIRGGGSADDLAAFSTEPVTRAVAGSRLPILVAIGHEVDVSLAERAADLAASTPSNAAELLLPDKKTTLQELSSRRKAISHALFSQLTEAAHQLDQTKTRLHGATKQTLETYAVILSQRAALLKQLHPKASLKRGFVLATKNGQLLKSARSLKKNDVLQLEFSDGSVDSQVQGVYYRHE